MFVMILLFLLYYYNSVHGRTCDTWHRTERGTISAYNYNNASRILRCIYRIQTSPESWIRLRWKKLGVDGGTMPNCNDDSIVVYTGCNTGSIRVARFCTKNMKSLPHDIYTRDNCMRINFNNPSGTSQGFIATYRSYSRYKEATWLPKLCTSSLWTKTITSLTGVVASPSWPSKYEKKSCSWKIKTGDSGKRYVLNIMDMNMYKRGSRCSTLYYDSIYIKGEKSMTTKNKKSWTFCNFRTYDGNIINTEYYQIYMRMTIRTTYPNYRGFLIGYVAYEDDVARALTSWGSIIGGLVVAFIAVTFVFCCYRRWRRRNLQEHQTLVYSQEAPVVHLPPHTADYPVQPSQHVYPPPTTYPNAPPVYSDKPPDYQPPPYVPPPGTVPPTYPQYPPQGYPPPQGYAPQGYAPQGYPPQGYAPPSNQANPAYPTSYHS